jgi:UDP-N-acetylmuramyl pentapeptide phosphotransferase/UDP-N-acetylglucosamine-1-phosphate transferase
MLIFFPSFFVSLLFSFLVIKYARIHAPNSLDFDLDGIQKFHQFAVPRIGGAGIFLGVLFGYIVFYLFDPLIGGFGYLLLLGVLPIFLSGFIEDVTKTISAQIRLFSAIISAALSGYLLDGWLTSLQIFGIDNLMASFPVIAIGITCIAVAGVSHSFNIIDGYNGLSATVGAIILLGIAYVAFQVSDLAIMVASFAMIGAILGFLVWNYPRGLIFLGDGGAYLIGFWVAELAVLLTSRHQEVSKWFPLLLCFYPIFETVFTIYRRIFIKKVSAGIPDATHLHQLIHRRVVKYLIGRHSVGGLMNANSATSPFLWILATCSAIPAVLFWKNYILLIGFSFLFAISYIYLYWSIVRFSTPKWLSLLLR